MVDLTPRQVPPIHVDTKLVVLIACAVALLAILAGGLLMWLLASRGVIVPATTSPTFTGITLSGATANCVIYATAGGVRSTCDDLKPVAPLKPPGSNINVKAPGGCICGRDSDGKLVFTYGQICDICFLEV